MRECKDKLRCKETSSVKARVLYNYNAYLSEQDYMHAIKVDSRKCEQGNTRWDISSASEIGARE